MDNLHAKPKRNLKIPEDSLKAKWSQEIKEEESVENHISKSLEWQIKSRKYYKKKRYTTLPEVYQKWYCQRKGSS